MLSYGPEHNWTRFALFPHIIPDLRTHASASDALFTSVLGSSFGLELSWYRCRFYQTSKFDLVKLGGVNLNCYMSILLLRCRSIFQNPRRSKFEPLYRKSTPCHRWYYYCLAMLKFSNYYMWKYNSFIPMSKYFYIHINILPY